MNQNFGPRTRWRLFALYVFPMWMVAGALFGADRQVLILVVLDGLGVF